jgi:hypothetical protein
LSAAFYKATYYQSPDCSKLLFQMITHSDFSACRGKVCVSTHLPFTDSQLNHFFSKHSNHKSIRIEILYMLFHCFQWKYIPINFCALSFWSPRLPAICIASDSANDCVFADTFFIVKPPREPYSSDAFYGFATSNVNHSLLLSAPFSPFHTDQTSVPFYGDFCSSCGPVSIFSIQICWFRQLHLYSAISTLLLSMHLYSSFTLDSFTLLALYQKIKFVQL